MFVIRMIAAAAAMMAWEKASAESTSYHVPHPLGWMYALPVGETPGWTSPGWFNFEFSQANIWNYSASFTDTRTGDEYSYEADFEASTAVVGIGFAAGSWGLTAEVPYVNHNGGFLDDFIDQFHAFGRFDRALRNVNPGFDNSFHIRKNGVEQLDSVHAEGVGNIKAKLKYWALPWRSRTPGACECGFALSVQVKAPTEARRHGLTSGAVDLTGMAHLGVPFGGASGAWASAAVTKIGRNELLAGWPQHSWLQMYELTLNLAADANFSFILQARMESPLLNARYLAYEYTYTEPEDRAAEREASGWHALTEWRGTQTAGIQWRWGKGHHVKFLIQEDWALGSRDGGRSWNYVTNSPDVSFITQWHFVL